VTARFAPWRRLNVWLYRRGVRRAILREVLRFQIAVCLALLAAGLVLWPVAARIGCWIGWIGAGAALSAWSFFSLTKLAPQFMIGQYTLAMGVAFFLRSQGRLLVAAVLLAAAIGWAKAPPWALLLGFSLSLAGIARGVLAFRAGPVRAFPRSPT
jgi:hypothetical protein